MSSCATAATPTADADAPTTTRPPADETLLSKKRRADRLHDLPAAAELRERRAVLVAAKTAAATRSASTSGRHSMDDDPEQSLEELASLADSAGLEVAGRLVQRRERPHPATYVGAGFADRIKTTVESLDAGLVISDDDLSPAQGRNLEKILGCRIIDRSELILDIFKDHARTRQARLQVELARLEYSLPRLKKMWSHLGRVRGGIGARGGMGEKQIEVDKRLVRNKIRDLKRDLTSIAARKARSVSRRAEEFGVALVGYTNAGKSSLFNRLAAPENGVLVANRLFSTLDTRTRAWDLGDGVRALLSDTVGFIRNIPHHLVASFHATLEEVRSADLLLHVVDVSGDDPLGSARAVRKVLKGIGCEEKRELLVLNKVDRLDPATATAEIDHFARQLGAAVAVSAHTGDGIDDLRDKVAGLIGSFWEELELELDAGDGRRRALIAANAQVLHQEDDPETGRSKFRIRIDPRFLGDLRGAVEDVDS